MALMLQQKLQQNSQFHGFGLWKKEIPIRQEVCELCQNHCKLTIASVDGQTLAYGFLCGRDYETKKRCLKNYPMICFPSERNVYPKLIRSRSSMISPSVFQWGCTYSKTVISGDFSFQHSGLKPSPPIVSKVRLN